MIWIAFVFSSFGMCHSRYGTHWCACAFGIRPFGQSSSFSYAPRAESSGKRVIRSTSLPRRPSKFIWRMYSSARVNQWSFAAASSPLFMSPWNPCQRSAKRWSSAGIFMRRSWR